MNDLLAEKGNRFWLPDFDVVRARHGWWELPPRALESDRMIKDEEYRWCHDSPDLDDIVFVGGGLDGELFRTVARQMLEAPAFEPDIDGLLAAAMRLLAPTGTVTFDANGMIKNRHGKDVVTSGTIARLGDIPRKEADKLMRRAERAGAVTRITLDYGTQVGWSGWTRQEKTGWIPAAVADARKAWENTPIETLAASGLSRVAAGYNASKAAAPQDPTRWGSYQRGDREIDAAAAFGKIVQLDAGGRWVPVSHEAVTRALIEDHRAAQAAAQAEAAARRRAAAARQAEVTARLDAWLDNRTVGEPGNQVTLNVGDLEALLDAAGAES